MSYRKDDFECQQAALQMAYENGLRDGRSGKHLLSERLNNHASLKQPLLEKRYRQVPEPLRNNWNTTFEKYPRFIEPPLPCTCSGFCWCGRR